MLCTYVIYVCSLAVGSILLTPIVHDYIEQDISWRYVQVNS